MLIGIPKIGLTAQQLLEQFPEKEEETGKLKKVQNLI